jgi:hypothetical protein
MDSAYGYTPAYTTQAARDAFRWQGKRYADHIEQSALEMAARFKARGQHDEARKMVTRTIGEALQGNDGI